MTRAKKPPFTIDLHPLVEAMGDNEFFRQMSQPMNKLPLEEWVAEMTPKKRWELLRRLQEDPTPTDSRRRRQEGRRTRRAIPFLPVQ